MGIKLLHISYDYPDAINASKPAVIKSLIDALASDFENVCISMNRTRKKTEQQRISNENLHVLEIFGLPFGLNFKSFLKRADDAVLRLDIEYGKFDFICAHKLTFEGPVAWALHREYGVPYVVVIRQTDIKVLKYRPDLRNKYTAILEQAAAIVFPSHWLKDSLAAFFSGDFNTRVIQPKSFLIPNVVGMERSFPAQEDNGKYVCVVSMKKDYYRIKNFSRLIKSFKLAAKDNENIHLDIFGYGEGMDKLHKEVEQEGMAAHISVNGPVDNKVIHKLMGAYRAFIMPSYPETFGLVYIEALRSGIPIIFTEHTAVDGFFNGYECQIKVNHTSVKSIYGAITEMESRAGLFRAEVARLQKDNVLDMFTAAAVSGAYRSMLETLFARAASAESHNNTTP